MDIATEPQSEHFHATLIKSAEDQINRFVEQPDDPSAARAVVNAVIDAGLNAIGQFDDDATLGEAVQVLRTLQVSTLFTRLYYLELSAELAFEDEATREAARADAKHIEDAIARGRELRERRHPKEYEPTLIAMTIARSTADERAWARSLLVVAKRSFERARSITDEAVLRIAAVVSMSRILWQGTAETNSATFDRELGVKKVALNNYRRAMGNFMRACEKDAPEARAEAAAKASRAMTTLAEIEERLAASWITRGHHIIHVGHMMCDQFEDLHRMKAEYPNFVRQDQIPLLRSMSDKFERDMVTFKELDDATDGPPSPLHVKTMMAARRLLISSTEIGRAVAAATSRSGIILLLRRQAELEGISSEDASDEDDGDEDAEDGGSAPPSVEG